MRTEQKIEGKSEIYDVDIIGETTDFILRKLMSKVDEVILRTEANKIITNGNTASILQDLHGYSLNPQTTPKVELVTISPFPIGKINKTDLLVDSFMKWTDNRIFFYKDEQEVFVLTVNDSRNALI